MCVTRGRDARVVCAFAVGFLVNLVQVPPQGLVVVIVALVPSDVVIEMVGCVLLLLVRLALRLFFLEGVCKLPGRGAVILLLVELGNICVVIHWLVVDENVGVLGAVERKGAAVQHLLPGGGGDGDAKLAIVHMYTHTYTSTRPHSHTTNTHTYTHTHTHTHVHTHIHTRTHILSLSLTVWDSYITMSPGTMVTLCARPWRCLCVWGGGGGNV
jgi:hypothetical protein